MRRIGLAGVALAVAATFSLPAHAVDCPGDLNGDGMVTVNEIVTAVNSALIGCAPAPQAAATCPGDLNGDNVVTVDEIIKGINSALLGCPMNTRCPYTFQDNTLEIGASCGYSGPFSVNETCSMELTALLLSDGSLVAVSVGSDPLITFGGVAASATRANLVAYFVGDDLTPQPLAGVMALGDDGATLIIDPETVPAFNIGGAECTFDRYAGGFTRVVSDQARRAAHGVRRLHASVP